MTRVHFVYPHGPAISCPDAIGRKVAEGLRETYEVIQYDWDETKVLDPDPDDVLLGHAHPAPWTILRRSMVRGKWKRVILLQPYHHGDLVQMAWADRLVARADLFLAITGRHWASSVDRSSFGHWAPKMVHVDLAVDRTDFPVLKKSFRPPGSRRYLYIGHDGWQKNLEHLASVARSLGQDISWIGPGKAELPGLVRLGVQDFSHERGRRLVADHDFLVIPSLADANPAVVLEAMAWGLVPVCTPESGYSGYEGIVNISATDKNAAASTLAALQQVEERRLTEIQRTNWELLDEHFHWSRFVDQVRDAIETGESPPIVRPSLSRRGRLLLAEIGSPYFFLRPRQLAASLRGYR